ncbi:MAG: phosphoglycerate kinase [Candidatus Nealsonbacteria bacterium]|nr:phosphoglycerate kinase [Candidatus Nealsonbacteria bacterium]
MKTLKDLDVKNKRVLVRCDFNVPLDEKGEINDDFRIKQTLPTIEYLLKNKARVILMSHLGDGGSLQVIQKRLEKYLGVPVLLGKKKAGEGEILLLENLRFHKGEEKNDEKFAKGLAKLGDVYVNEAFAVCHRPHASIIGVPKYLPSAAGFLLEKEIKILSRVLEDPWRPLVVIIGGLKIESKIKVIKQFLEKADQLLVGGKIAEPILIVKGICVGRPWPLEEVVKEIEKFNLTSTKLHLPIDALVSPDETGEMYVNEAAPGRVRKDEMLLDIGPETIKMFSKIIKEAKMIVWAGPVGLFERPFFEKGTKAIAEQIVRNYKAFKIVGGGDTLSALKKFGLRDKFDHISTGGGAMLAFLGGEELPGLKILEQQ